MLPARSHEHMKDFLQAARQHISVKRLVTISVCRLALPACMCMFVSYALAQQPAAETVSGVASRYPAGSIKSISEADSALAEISKERSEVEARYSKEEQTCHPRFFATSCIEEAKERRRKATMQLRAVEIEANAFKRRARVIERDQELKERQVKAEAERAERIKLQPEAESTAAVHEKTVDAEQESERKVKTTIFPDRQKKHEAKLDRIKAEEAANAKKRAENIAEYERKVQAAKERQQEVAARKAEKEQKRRMKQKLVPESK